MYHFGKYNLYFRRYFNLLKFKLILRSLQSPEVVERKYVKIMEIIDIYGKDILLRKPGLIKKIVKKAPLLIASPLYTEIMQVGHLFFSAT